MTTTTQPRPETNSAQPQGKSRGAAILDKDETRQMIASDKVEGTPVFDRTGEKIGTVRKIMIGKRDGRVHYVVMGFGGLFGMGEDSYPLPWDALDYDTRVEGYKLTHLTKDDIEPGKAPSFRRNEEPEWSNDYDQRIRLYYLRA